MKSTRTLWIVRYFCLAVLATVVSAGLLSAEEYTCTVSLTGETRWGATTLPAGDYTFKINTDKSPYWATVRGANGSVMIPALSIDDHYFAGRSMLIVARQGGKRSVRFFHLGSAEFRNSGGGVVFSYPRPRDEFPLMANEPQLIERVPVTVNGK